MMPTGKIRSLRLLDVKLYSNKQIFLGLKISSGGGDGRGVETSYSPPGTTAPKDFFLQCLCYCYYLFR